MLNKRGQGLDLLKTGIIALVVVGVVGTIGGYILSQFQGQFTAGTAGAQIAGNATSTLVGVMAWLPIVGITIIGAVVLGLVLVYIANR